MSDIREEAARGRVDRLLLRLEDERSWVREEAALALAEFPEPKVARRLEVLVEAPIERGWVRAAAAHSLGRMANRESLVVLTSAAATPGNPTELKLELIDALCAFPDQPEALQAVLALEKDDDLLVSAVAAHRARTRCAL